MVKVIIDGREKIFTGRIAEVISAIVEHADRLKDGSKILRFVLRKEVVKATIEEDL